MISYHLTVNGIDYPVIADQGRNLLSVIRTEMSFRRSAGSLSRYVEALECCDRSMKLRLDAGYRQRIGTTLVQRGQARRPSPAISMAPTMPPIAPPRAPPDTGRPVSPARAATTPTAAAKPRFAACRTTLAPPVGANGTSDPSSTTRISTGGTVCLRSRATASRVKTS